MPDMWDEMAVGGQKQKAASDSTAKRKDKLAAEKPVVKKATPQETHRPVDSLVDALPAIGGLAGGVAGGGAGSVFGMGIGAVPGAVGGAALGGAGGEAAAQLLRRAMGREAPGSSMEAAQGIGGQAALQGGMELGGIGAAKGLAQVARPIMRSGIGRGIMARADLAKTALEEGIPATKAGLKKLWVKIEEESQAAQGILRRHTRRGVTYNPVDGIKTTFPLAAAAATGDAFPQTAMHEYMNTAQKILDENPGHWSPVQLQKKRQSFDVLAKGLRKKLDSGDFTATDLVSEKIYKGMADWCREELHKIPGMAESDARQSALIELKNALLPRTNKAVDLATQAAPSAVGAGVGMAVGHSPMERARNAAIGAAAGSPAVMSNLALLLHSPALEQWLPQIGRLGQTMLQP